MPRLSASDRHVWLNKHEIDLAEPLWLLVCLIATGVLLWIGPVAFSLLAIGVFVPPVGADELRLITLGVGIGFAVLGLYVNRLTRD